jgi:uncharacterized protein (TIGR02453 family)
MPQDLQKTLDFLRDLRDNNERPWFEANRKRYQEARAAFETLIEDVLLAFSDVEDLDDTSVKDCVYRINRDVRFSKDKSPYKVNMGAIIGRGGRKGNAPSYYLQIQPCECFIAGGVYMPDMAQLGRIRDFIAEDARELRGILADAEFQKYYTFSGDQLKTAPKGYPADHPDIDLLRYKQFLASHMLSEADVLSDDLVPHIVAACKALKPFVHYFHDVLTQER